VRWLFLRLLALTALGAVVSWWVQVDGLVGAHGITPATDYLDAVRDFAAGKGWSDLERWHQVPTLLWLLPSDHGLHLLCGMATAGAVRLLFNVVPGPALLLLWLSYLSLVTSGGVFMGYRWDELLLEGDAAVVGLLAGDPFPDGPPRYIRSTLWYYTFTSGDERDRTGAIWTRERADHDFCPRVTLVDGALRIAHLPQPEAP